MAEMGQLSERDAAEADKALSMLTDDERKHLIARYDRQRRHLLVRPFTKHGARLQELGLAVPVGEVGLLRQRTAYLLSIWGGCVAAHANRPPSNQEPA